MYNPFIIRYMNVHMKKAAANWQKQNIFFTTGPIFNSVHHQISTRNQQQENALVSW